MVSDTIDIDVSSDEEISDLPNNTADDGNVILANDHGQNPLVKSAPWQKTQSDTI